MVSVGYIYMIHVLIDFTQLTRVLVTPLTMKMLRCPTCCPIIWYQKLSSHRGPVDVYCQNLMNFQS